MGTISWQAAPTAAEQLEAAKASAVHRISGALAAALDEGQPYTMPDGTDDIIQTRADDRQNLMGLAIEARDLQAVGETGAVQEFRAQSNARYQLTPGEMIALTDAALVHYKTLMAQSWDRKDAINAVSLEDHASLDDAIAEVDAITW